MEGRKRSHEDRGEYSYSKKKFKLERREDYVRSPEQRSKGAKQHDRHNDHPSKSKRKPVVHHEDAVSQLPPAVFKSGPVPNYSHFTVPRTFPPLPPINDPILANAPFKHKSAVQYNRSAFSSTIPDITYERLEFLGDAYIELIASRLLDERFGHIPAGRQSQLRELLVKNETLAEYSRAYGFDQKVEVGSFEAMMEEAKGKGNKGFNKVMGDVFEAYVAAVIRSDHENGFAVAEKWLTALWAPKLLEVVRNDRSYAVRSDPLTHDQGEDPTTVYNPAAKAELQKRILGHNVKLSYEKYKDSVELKGDQLGQNMHYVALYLTGYGYERKLLGKGEGKNKVEAGNWAATDAMWGEAKGIVEECEEKLKAHKKKREEEKAKQLEESNGKGA